MNNIIGQNLKKIRIFFRLQQNEFAEKLGITPSLLSRYETGSLELADSVKYKLFNFGINMNWLFSGHGGMIREKTLPSLLKKEDVDNYKYSKSWNVSYVHDDTTNKDGYIELTIGDHTLKYTVRKHETFIIKTENLIIKE